MGLHILVTHRKGGVEGLHAAEQIAVPVSYGRVYAVEARCGASLELDAETLL